MWSGVIACKICMNLTYYELCCFTNNFHSLDTFKNGNVTSPSNNYHANRFRFGYMKLSKKSLF